MREKGEQSFDDVIEDDDEEEGPEKEVKSEAAAETSNDSGNDTTSHSSDESGGDAATVDESDPAFLYAAVDQRPLYIRPSTWELLEDQKYYAEGELRERFGVRNVETRELDEVIAEIIAEELSPERIAEKVVELRGFDP